MIVGGGAAGFAAAEMLRRQGYKGSIVMLSDDEAAPVDRPNLSKDYLAGNAPEEWIPLRGDDFYKDNGIDLRLKAKVAAIDPKAREVRARQRQQGFVRPPAAGDRRRAGAPADCRARTCRTSIRCARWPTAAPSSRAAKEAQARRRDRRELHRPRGRGLAARAPDRGPCRGAGEAADGAHPRARHGRSRAQAARGEGRRLPSRGFAGRDRGQAGEAEERRRRSTPTSS